MDADPLHGMNFRAQRGLTLIELVVFMVVISVGLAGILGALNLSTRNSANPMLLKQQAAIAESLLEEIESKPFTYCDPDDANVLTATSATVGAGTINCASNAQGLGASPTGESRYTAGNPYDNVGDYASLPTMNAGILKTKTDGSDGSAVVTGLDNYTASVKITKVGNVFGLKDASGNPDDTAALKIEVTVSMAGQTDLILTGYRYRYAPNSP